MGPIHIRYPSLTHLDDLVGYNAPLYDTAKGSAQGEMYGNTRLITKTHLNYITTAPVVKQDNGASLRRFLERYSDNIEGLRQSKSKLKVGSYSTLSDHVNWQLFLRFYPL